MPNKKLNIPWAMPYQPLNVKPNYLKLPGNMGNNLNADLISQLPSCAPWSQQSTIPPHQKKYSIPKSAPLIYYHELSHQMGKLSNISTCVLWVISMK